MVFTTSIVYSNLWLLSRDCWNIIDIYISDTTTEHSYATEQYQYFL